MLIVNYETALDYWRLADLVRRTGRYGAHEGGFSTREVAKRNKCRATLSVEPPNADILDLGIMQFLEPPIDVLLGSKDARFSCKTTKQHIYTGSLPFGSFVYGIDNLAVCSPELCLLQMARSLTLIELIQLIYEFCGTYSLPPKASQKDPMLHLPMGFYTRAPLTNKKKLMAYVSRIKGINGRRKVERALSYVLEGSASPMETKLIMLLLLPYKMGGYGLSAPDLNSSIVPEKSLRSFTSKAFYSCDLFWPKYNLAVEYDSNQFHTGSTRIADDAARRNSLYSLGITVITVTNRQINSSAQFDRVARQIAKHMGKRLVMKKPDFFDARHELRKILL